MKKTYNLYVVETKEGERAFYDKATAKAAVKKIISNNKEVIFKIYKVTRKTNEKQCVYYKRYNEEYNFQHGNCVKSLITCGIIAAAITVLTAVAIAITIVAVN